MLDCIELKVVAKDVNILSNQCAHIEYTGTSIYKLKLSLLKD